MANDLAEVLAVLAAGVTRGNGIVSIPIEVSSRMTERQIDILLETLKKKGDEEAPLLDPREYHREWAKQNKIPKWLEPEVWKNKQNASADS